MNRDPEQTNREERPNQPPKPECCLVEGQAQAPAKGAASRTTAGKRTQGTSQAASGSRTLLKQSSLETTKPAGGHSVFVLEAHIEETAKGKVSEDLPGSKSVAREDRAVQKLGRPAAFPGTNCGSQREQEDQRQEGLPTGQQEQGIRLAHSSPGSGTRCPNLDQGASTPTQPAKETSAVRTTETSWRSSLRAISNKAAQEPKHRFGGLYRLLNQESLRECFYALRKEAAPGVDGVSFQDYEKNLESNLADLVRRLRNKSYRTRLVRRKYIPKGNGKLRPLGIPALEDKLVQSATAAILSAIYEQDFLECSYGYRPGRSPQQAVSALTEALFRGKFEFVVEADIKGYFEHIQHDWLLRMLALRVNDGALLGLIGKWLRAGILEEDGRIEHPESGTPQGGSVSPVLANVYLHYVLDLWFERRVRKGNQGQSVLLRFADDFVCAFDYRHEAEAFEQALTERMKKFGLELASDKTKRIRFGRWGGGHNGQFDFLGFEFAWGLNRRGWPTVKRRTSRKKLLGAIQRFTEWIKRERSTPLPQLMETLRAKYQGHWNYYGVIGNMQSLNRYYYQSNRLLMKWLNRRSQRRSLTWKTLHRKLQRFKVPPPHVVERARGILNLPCRADWNPELAAQVNLYGEHYGPARA
jgi:RNA-directed DNA polymerase